MCRLRRVRSPLRVRRERVRVRVRAFVSCSRQDPHPGPLSAYRAREKELRVFDQIRHTILSELSDLNDVASVTRVTMRLLFAGILGAALGFNREKHGKSAGLRTHVLVALGAAVFAMTPQLAGATPGDMTRVVQGLVVGIGFLGAGAIVKGDKPGEISGLTTAAGIWMTAAIGMTVGYGREMTAVLSTIFAMVALAVIPHVAPKNKHSIDE